MLKSDVEVLVIVPVGLSRGVVNSQVLNITKLFPKDVKVRFFSIHGSDLVDYFDYKDSAGIKEYISHHNVKMIYTRSQFDFLKIKFYSNKCPKVFYDFRGAVFAESFLRNSSIVRALALFLLDFFVFMRADFIGTVSNNFSEWLKKVFLSNKAISVVPCCINEVDFNVSNEIVGSKFVYVGGSSKYQNIPKMIEYLNILSLSRDVSLTIISNDMDKIRVAVGHLVKFKVEYLSLSHEEVLSVLSDFDFGFILRDNLLLNRVASPIKLLEYTSCGVIPIMTPYVGDYSKIIQENNLGVIVHNDLNWGMIDDIAKQPNIRFELKKFSAQYTWGNYKDVMFNIFNTIR
ncbi:glycosyltransferase family 4 protein [Shewanella sp. MSW]|uniref:glycosyltransferase family 4 protein n=1 Tax=Shewanella sp. MSW TaxID=2569536 RepID=UPI001184783B|nr:glycosyltransferase family 4 protein [Shewanella sp. MSW]